MKLSLLTTVSLYLFAIHLIFATNGLGLRPQSSMKRLRRLLSPQPRYPLLLPPIRGHQESRDANKTPSFGGGNGGGNGGGRTRKRGHRTISPRKRTRPSLKKSLQQQQQQQQQQQKHQQKNANENRLPYEHILRARYRDYEDRERRNQKLRLLAEENDKKKKKKALLQKESESLNSQYHHDSSEADTYPNAPERDDDPYPYQEREPQSSKGFSPPRGFQAEAFNPGYQPTGFKDEAPGHYSLDPPPPTSTNAKRKHFNIHRHNQKPKHVSYNVKNQFQGGGYEESSPLPAVPSSLIGHRPDMNKQALVTEAPESALRWVDSKFIHNQHGTFTNQVLTEFVPLENWQSYHQAFSSLVNSNVDSNVDSKLPIKKDPTTFASPPPQSTGFEDRYHQNHQNLNQYEAPPAFASSPPTPSSGSNFPRRKFNQPSPKPDHMPYPDPSVHFNPSPYYDRQQTDHRYQPTPPSTSAPPAMAYPEFDYYGDTPEPQGGQKAPEVADYSDYGPGLGPNLLQSPPTTPQPQTPAEYDDGDPLNDFDWDWLKPGYVEEEVSLEPEFRGSKKNDGTLVSDRRSQIQSYRPHHRRRYPQTPRRQAVSARIMPPGALGSYSEFENPRFWD
ncbi:putative uncharacterized protein DDB_G0291608 isoform X2 [Tigriopus californicus]|uniref:putative uncharacterized protein DDB_G0291608 isoform X2 n=1 Tax=Tigriopus californicus TaxID=6832 RepID=UPI0027DA9C5F|nr:putative uncharacterized protein DDB_G0291608 isoform X2 [Tigriopus californicus]